VGKKQPRVAFNPAPTKQPTIASTPHVVKIPTFGAVPTAYADEHPSWRVARLQVAAPFGWSDVSAAKILEIRTKLASFESMTWNDILVLSKKQNHSVAVNDLSKAARDCLVELNIVVDDLVSLRLSGKERVWGYRSGAVLHVVWWDPDHEVCPSLLRHT
jgi:hypothetical protein